MCRHSLDVSGHPLLNLVRETIRRITAEFVFHASCLGKLFFSILKQRLLGHAISMNVLHKSQIDFLPKNRTSDHVLTLRTLIDKYVHGDREKKYTLVLLISKTHLTPSGMKDSYIS